MELSTTHVHDGTTKLSVHPTLLHDSLSPKGEASSFKTSYEPPARSRALLA